MTVLTLLLHAVAPNAAETTQPLGAVLRPVPICSVADLALAEEVEGALFMNFDAIRLRVDGTVLLTIPYRWHILFSCQDTRTAWYRATFI